MSELKLYKSISAVPTPYTPNALYAVRSGTGIDLFVANSDGTAVFKHNGPITIVGILSTKAEFDAAVTDGNIMYIGDPPTAHEHTSSDIIDFNSAVATNSAVAANTAKVTNQTHSGDVTGATVLSIANDAVTNAKMANMATKTYKGRTSASTGDPEDVPVSTLKSDLALTKSDIGLANVDNTSDNNKPVSTATQAALNGKENTFSKGNIVQGENVTLTGTLTGRLVGPGDIVIAATGVGGSAGLQINDQSGTTYTLVLADANKLIRCNNAAAITVTVPTNATAAIAVGSVISIEQQGAGIVTVAPAGGVTINPLDRKTWGQNAVIQLIKVGTDTWNLLNGTV